MDITVIHGQAHKGSTYNITSMLLDKLGAREGTVHEFFMPRDTPDYCVGCFQCIYKSEELCPHSEKVRKIIDAMRGSEVIIFDSPTYCYEMTGQLKTFFDHTGFMWMVHRPRGEMFSKIGIVVSTTAGAGAGNVAKSIARQLFWWGVPVVHKLGVTVNASSWKDVSDKIKQKIQRRTDAICAKVKNRASKVSPGLKTRLMFGFMRKMQRSNSWNKSDREYWEKNGWLTSPPWK